MSMCVGVAVNGNVVQLNVARQSSAEVCQWLEHLRCRSGEPAVTYTQPYSLLGSSDATSVIPVVVF